MQSYLCKNTTRKVKDNIATPYNERKKCVRSLFKKDRLVPKNLLI